mgnify:CR=1 FL=1
MQIENPSYHLFQTLSPHTAAVRSLATRGPWLVTGSIDKTCKIYKKVDGRYVHQNDVNLFDDYILSLYITKNLQNIIVGCKNSIIYVLDFEGNPLNMLEGHSGPVNSLSETTSGYLISGSWDGTAKIWDLSAGSLVHTLDGHTYAVAVLGLDNDIIVTGSQDKNIHIWHGHKKAKTISNAHGDIIRDLVKFGEIGFLSCSNDEMIKMWSVNGELINTFLGHSAFVFSVTCTEDGRIISGSEDKTVKIWKDDECKQSISHPSTIWVTRVDESGDIISACGDGFARVFSTDPNRKATEEEIDALERESEMAAAQGPEGLSEAELAKLPSVDSLDKIKGKRDGEIRVFKNGTQPEAYLWKQETGSWEKIGDVLGQKSTHFYEGDKYFPQGEYDYIFEVDDESKIPKRLPFNNGDNPLEVAEKFIAREGLHKGYIEQITNFIRQNTRHTQGRSNTRTQQQQPQKKKVQSKYFPYLNPITFQGGNFDGLVKKIFEFNEALKDTTSAMKETEITRFGRIIEKLKDTANYHTTQFTDLELELITLKLLKWPLDKMLPVLDLFRIFLVHHNSEKLFAGLDGGLHYLGFICQVLRSTDNDIIITLCLKILANLFLHLANKNSILKYQDMILDAIESQQIHKREKDTVRNALSAFIFNLSTGMNDDNTKEEVIQKFFIYLPEIIIYEKNPDNILRYLITYGNVLSLCPSSIHIAQNIGLKSGIANIEAPTEQAKECQKDIIELIG